ncbi:MAG: ribonuclease E/G, partial [Planctomycetes bacterium]|nr:ribonuclease E/G [Planctomycetota bacterium]
DAPFCDVGLIARTSAAGASREELLADFEHLRGQWDAAMALKVDDEGPRLLWSEPSEVIRAVRDVLRKGTEKIIIDAPEWKSSLAALLDELQGECAPPIECWSDSTSLFEKFDVERPWQLLFRSRVPVGQGASIVIHETEALTAIDVNSGRLDGGSLEETAMMANLLAAEEIARQIRLRDLGGILVIDFIDLQDRDHRSALEDNFEEWMGEDRARLKLGRLGAFGLLTMTRRRMGTGLPRAFEFSCKHCAGSGTSLHHEAGALRAMRALRVFFAQPGQRGGSLKVTPGAAAVLQSHYQQEMDGWEWDLDIQVDPQLAPGDFVLRP